MEKFQHMKVFINSALEYSQHRSEKTASSLQRHLQILCVASDMSIFDPDSSVAVEFYVSLHELMSNLESRSSLMWAAISVLQHACRNTAARSALIHTYKFTPILTKLLGTHLIHDKRLRVLQLLQELTYGVKISWQEAHLSVLISRLTEWIMGNEKEVVALSLGILVNLCYKNLPAIYTLMRSVDSKQFLRKILNLQNENVSTQVQVCKLLIILEHISGDIPAGDILNLVKVTFTTLNDAFKEKDIFLLRHIVEFFSDVRSNAHSCEILRTYKRYEEDTQQLLKLIETDADPECVGMVFDFLHQLICLKVNALSPLYPKLVHVTLQWIQTDQACTQSLSLLRTIIVDLQKDDRMNEPSGEQITELLEQNLSVFFLMMDSGGEAGFPPSSETRTRLSALIQLLRKMCQVPVLQDKILQTISVQVIQNIFQPLLTCTSNGSSNLFQKEVVAFYVYALDLISCLGQSDKKWSQHLVDLLSHPQVQRVLAIGLYTGDEAIKHEVLCFAGARGNSTGSLSGLARTLCDLEPLLMGPSSNIEKMSGACSTVSNIQQDLTPFFNLAQEGRLDEFIGKLKKVVEKSELRDIPMSSVMELYEYKLAALGHSERALQASLEAANQHSVHLQHRLAQMNAEASRLHQMLYHSQQSVEGLQQEKKELVVALEHTKTDAEESHLKVTQDLKHKQRQVHELATSVEALKRANALRDDELEVLKDELAKLRDSYKTVSSQKRDIEEKLAARMDELRSLQNRNSELVARNNKLEDKLHKTENKKLDYEAEIGNLSKQNSGLQRDLANLDKVCKVQEKTIEEKEQELNIAQNKLMELEKIRETIFAISAGKKKVDK